MSQYRTALIVGAGSGLSAALARAFSGAGLKVALAARTPDKLAAIAAETGAKTFRCDAVKRDEVAKLFAAVTDQARRARRRRLQRELPPARAVRRARPRRGREVPDG